MVGSALNRYLEAIASNNAIESSLTRRTFAVKSSNDGKETSNSQPMSALRMTATLRTANWRNNQNASVGKTSPISIGGKKQVLSLKTDNEETDSVTTGENDSDSSRINHRQPQHVQHQNHPSPFYSYSKDAKWRLEEKEKELYTQGVNKHHGRKQVSTTQAESNNNREYEKLKCVCNDTKNLMKLTRVTFDRDTTTQKMNRTRQSYFEDRKVEEEDIAQFKCTHCGHHIVVAPSATTTNTSPLSSPPRSPSNVHSILHSMSPNKSYATSAAALATTPRTRGAATQTAAVTETTKLVAKSFDSSMPKQYQTTSSPNPIIPDTTTNSSPWRKLQSATTTNIKNEILSSITASVPADRAGDDNQDRVHYTTAASWSPKSQLLNNNNTNGTRYSRHASPIKSWPLTLYSSGNNHALHNAPTPDSNGKVAEPAVIATRTDVKHVADLDPNGTSNLSQNNIDSHFISIKERKLQLWGSGAKDSLRSGENKKSTFSDRAIAIESSYAPSSTDPPTDFCKNPAAHESKECNTIKHLSAVLPFKSQSSRLQEGQQQLMKSSGKDFFNRNKDAGIRISPERNSVFADERPASTRNKDTNSSYNLRQVFQNQQEAIRVSLKANPRGSNRAAVVTPDDKIIKGHPILSSKEDFTSKSTASTSPTGSFKSNCNEVLFTSIAPVTPSDEDKALSTNLFPTRNQLSGIRRSIENKKWDDDFHQHRKVKQDSSVPSKDDNSKLKISVPNRNVHEITSLAKTPNNSSFAFNSSEQNMYPTVITKDEFPSKKDFSEKVKEEHQKNEKHLNSPLSERPSVRDRVRALHLKVNSSNNGVPPEKGISDFQQNKNYLRNRIINASQPQLSLQTINSGRQMCVSPLSSVDASCSSFWNDELELDDDDAGVTSSDEETVSTLTNPTFTGSMASFQKPMSNSSIAKDKRKKEEIEEESPTWATEKGGSKLMNMPATNDNPKIHLAGDGGKAGPGATLSSMQKSKARQISIKAHLPHLPTTSTAFPMQKVEVARNSAATGHYIKDKALLTEGVITHKDRSIFSLHKQLRPPSQSYESNCNNDAGNGNLRLEYLNKLGRTMELAADFKKRYKVWEKSKDKTSSEIPFFMKRRTQEASTAQRHAVVNRRSTGRSDDKHQAIYHAKAPMQPTNMHSRQDAADTISSVLPPLHPSQKFLGTKEIHRKTSESFSRMIERFSQGPNAKRVTHHTKGTRMVSGEI